MKPKDFKFLSCKIAYITFKWSSELLENQISNVA